MSKDNFGWDYPAGCSGPPEEVVEIMEDYETFEAARRWIDDGPDPDDLRDQAYDRENDPREDY